MAFPSKLGPMTDSDLDALKSEDQRDTEELDRRYASTDLPAEPSEPAESSRDDTTPDSAALRRLKEDGTLPPRKYRKIPAEVFDMNEAEKKKWIQWEYEREKGKGDHYFRIRLVWNFLPKHSFISDPQYDKYIENLNCRDIQFVKRLVQGGGTKSRVTAMKYVVPEAPQLYVKDLSSNAWKRKDVRQLYEYLLQLKSIYADGSSNRITADEIIDKYEKLFRESDDVNECLRLGEMITKARNIDLTPTQAGAIREVDEEDYQFVQNLLKGEATGVKDESSDPADTYKPKDGGAVPANSGEGPLGFEDEGPVEVQAAGEELRPA